MNRYLVRSLRAGLFGVMPLAFLASTASAQEEEGGACTADLSPASIRIESPAIRVTARLSRNVGQITAVEGPGASGVRLSTSAELELMAKAAQEDPEEPIALSADGHTATLWLNTEDAEPGSYTITLEGETGTCTSEITIDGLRAAGVRD